MKQIVAFPLIGLAVILQSSVVSQVRLLSGYADLPLILLAAWSLQDRVDSAWHWAIVTCILMSFVSRMPWAVYAGVYLIVVFIAQSLQKRIWQAPLLAMFSVAFFGTVLMNGVSFVALALLGSPISLTDALGLIALPSLLMNILLSIPLHAFTRDLARWVYSNEAQQ